VTELHRVSRISSEELKVGGKARILKGTSWPGDVDGVCLSSSAKSHGSHYGSSKRVLHDSKTGSMSGTRASGTSSVVSVNGSSIGSSSKTSFGGTASNSVGTSVDTSADTSAGESQMYPGPCDFHTPIGVTTHITNGKTYVWIADSGNNAIKQLVISANDINNNFLFDNIVADPRLNTPYGVIYYDTYLYVTSFNGHVIIRFKPFDFNIDTHELIALSNDNIYAGASGVPGHVDSTLLESRFMNPTGITVDGDGNLYLNDWYKIPGEFGASEGRGSHHSASRGDGSKATGGKSDASRGDGSKATGGSKSGTVVGAIDLAGSAVGGKSGSASIPGDRVSSDGFNVPMDPYSTSFNWGHEPQYLHSVRRISISNEVVDTVAGGRIPGIFEPSHGSSSSGKSGGATHASGGSKATGTAGNGGTTKRRLHPSADSKNTFFSDGYYSYNREMCPVCANKGRRLNHNTNGSGKGSGSASNSASKGSEIDGISGGLSLLPGGSDYTHGETASYIDEESSFNDGYSLYARFFKPTGIVVSDLNSDILTIWVADFGNNRVRNITCADGFSPTFDPTMSPTAFPTFEHTSKPTKSPASPKLAKGKKVKVVKGPNVGSGKAVKAPKKPSKSVKSGDSGSIGRTSISDAMSGTSQLSTVAIVLISIGAASVAAACVYFLYFNQYYRNRFFGSKFSEV